MPLCLKLRPGGGPKNPTCGKFSGIFGGNGGIFCIKRPLKKIPPETLGISKNPTKKIPPKLKNPTGKKKMLVRTPKLVVIVVVVVVVVEIVSFYTFV